MAISEGGIVIVGVLFLEERLEGRYKPSRTLGVNYEIRENTRHSGCFGNHMLRVWMVHLTLDIPISAVLV